MLDGCVGMKVTGGSAGMVMGGGVGLVRGGDVGLVRGDGWWCGVGEG